MLIQSPTLLPRKGYTFFPCEGRRLGGRAPKRFYPLSPLFCPWVGPMATNPSNINNFYNVLKEPWRH